MNRERRSPPRLPLRRARRVGYVPPSVPRVPLPAQAQDDARPPDGARGARDPVRVASPPVAAGRPRSVGRHGARGEDDRGRERPCPFPRRGRAEARRDRERRDGDERAPGEGRTARRRGAREGARLARRRRPDRPRARRLLRLARQDHREGAGRRHAHPPLRRLGHHRRPHLRHDAAARCRRSSATPGTASSSSRTRGSGTSTTTSRTSASDGWTASRITGPARRTTACTASAACRSTRPATASAWFSTKKQGDYGQQGLALRRLLPRAAVGRRRAPRGAGAPAREAFRRAARRRSRASTRSTSPTARAQLTIRTWGDGDVRLFGVALERDVPGVVYDALGRQRRAHPPLGRDERGALGGPARAPQAGAHRPPVRHQRERGRRLPGARRYEAALERTLTKIAERPPRASRSSSSRRSTARSRARAASSGRSPSS